MDGGNPSFTSGYGTAGLNLNAWLDAYRNWKQHGVYTRVNCYDQAAITEIALCLGISHKQIHWEYNQVYGFIDSVLVGWEKVNNPYFEDRKTMRLGQHDSRRQPFRNHAYLSWSREPVDSDFYNDYNKTMKGVANHEEYVAKAKAFTTKNETELFMIDSCGGPHVGNETREQYESQIELIGDPTKSFSTYVKTNSAKSRARWEEDHHLGAGVTESYNLLPSGQMKAYEGAIKNVTNRTELPNPTSVSVVPNIGTLQAVFCEYVQIRMLPRWNNHKMYTIRPYTTSEGTTVDEIKINFSTDGHTRLDRAASMRIAVNNAPGGAQKALAEHLAFKALSIQNGGAEIGSQGHIYVFGNHWKSVNVVGTYRTRAFLWYNVAIEITVEHSVEWQECDNAVLNKILLSLAEMSVKVS
jgi:hypothetical protein